MAGVANIVVSNNTIAKNGMEGSRIGISDDVLFYQNVIRDNGRKISKQNVSAGIRIIERSNDITIRRNHFEANGYGVWADDSTTSINATLNWWGSESGPSGHGPGTGDAVSGNVHYQPWLSSGIIGERNTADPMTDREPGATKGSTSEQAKSPSHRQPGTAEGSAKEETTPTTSSQPGFHFITGVMGIVLLVVLGYRRRR